MFIKTVSDRLINSEKVIYFELVPCINVDKAHIEACLSGNKTFTVFDGTMSEAQRAFCTLANALSAGDKTVLDFANKET